MSETDARVIHREDALENPALLAEVEAQLREQVMMLIVDAEGIGLPKRDPWWAALANAARTEHS
ncbi:MAG: hypothetical protein HZA52_10760 [Planctomycetes bacterium]|nr:hypothetical protein [Planctomycetota bacterium]